MGREYIKGRLGLEKVREERISLVVRLRDEQSLTFRQIAAQVGRTLGWCAGCYYKAKEERREEVDKQKDAHL